MRDRAIRRRQKLQHSMEVLVRHKGVVKAAAAELGIAETTLREQMSEFVRTEGYETLFDAAYQLGQQDRIAA